MRVSDGFVVGVGDFVFGERGDDAVAREHGAALDDGGGGDAVDADEGRELDGEFAHEVVGGGLAGVVGDAALFGDDGVGAGGEDQAAAQALVLPESGAPRRRRGRGR